MLFVLLTTRRLKHHVHISYANITGAKASGATMFVDVRGGGQGVLDTIGTVEQARHALHLLACSTALPQGRDVGAWLRPVAGHRAAALQIALRTALAVALPHQRLLHHSKSIRGSSPNEFQLPIADALVSRAAFQSAIPQVTE